ncbi:MAG: DNA topoisomerase 4 subunit A [Clostridia bacterium]|nr:DNA topoisomerase 4 subunit A [Clostridia bacterium]
MEEDNNVVENKKTRKSKEHKEAVAPNKDHSKEEIVAGGVITRSLDEVLHDSMIPYSEHVILDRALPRVEDGLKPVQRRILYTMMELGLEPDKPFRKSARIVGDCLGKYHPHGDTSIYDAMVRMAQQHNMGEILVQGHGNFGSNDGDGAAAMRYTEARMAPLALELLRDLEKDTVKWSLNFDDTLKEPDMLPGRFPNLLVNGAMGIAVGLATNIPPHNLAEVIDGVVAYIDNPKITLNGLMHYIKGPDFPTGANMILTDIERAYSTGKGKVIMRAKYHIEETKSEKKNIVITEMPYQVNKAKLLQSIVELREEKKGILTDISDVRDESDRHGMRAVIVVKKEGNPKAIMDLLMKSTELESSFAINMVAIAGGKPKVLGLKEIISYYVNYQREIILRRSKYELAVAKDRLHILQGLLIAIKNIDDVVAIIKKASSPVDAKVKLKDRFFLSERQAQAILDMRLARLTNLEVNKITNEIAELEIKIKRLTAIINSEALQLDIVKEELLEIKRKYKSPRKTAIISEKDIDKEPSTIELDKPEEIVIGVTAQGYIKAFAKKAYDSANKTFKDGGKLSQVHTITMNIMNNTTLLIFTNKGYCVKLDPSELELNKFRDKGINPRELFKDFGLDEKIVAIFEAKFDSQDLLFFTEQGFVKRTKFKEYDLVKSYFQAVKVREDDQVINIVFDEPETDMIFATQKGQVLYAEKTDVPEQGRISGGVRGINLYEGDKVVYADICTDEGELAVITKQGYSKRVVIAQIDKLPRYRKGVRLIALGATDDVAYVSVCTLPEPFIIETDEECYAISSEDLEIESRTTKGKPSLKEKGKILKVYCDKS